MENLPRTGLYLGLVVTRKTGLAGCTFEVNWLAFGGIFLKSSCSFIISLDQASCSFLLFVSQWRLALRTVSIKVALISVPGDCATNCRFLIFSRLHASDGMIDVFQNFIPQI